MRTAIDTNVISALWSGEPGANDLAIALGAAYAEGGLVICGPVYMELLAYPKATVDFVDDFLRRTRVEVDFAMNEAVWRRAGAGFQRYAQRRREEGSGVAKRLLADFLVGAHAVVSADRLMTLDEGRYRNYFGDLTLIGS